MRSAQTALRASLVALAAALAALVAHVTIDVAGDYLLAHDTYDGMPHESRAVFIVAVAALAIAAASRVLFDLLDRRCGSTASLLRRVRGALGSPAAFVAQTALLAVLTLAGMELLDCAASGTPVDGIEDLFGGSLLLGLSTISIAAALAGWLAHRLVRLLAEYEPALAALVFRFIVAAAALPVRSATAYRGRSSRTTLRALLLARRGTKRGPPLPIPG
jgi:hypothetical protein